MLWSFRWSKLVFALLAVGAVGFAIAPLGATLAEPQCDETQLDNDLSQDDLENFCENPSLPTGEITTKDNDKDGDFDEMTVGTQGSAFIYGWAEFDGQLEIELVVSDPTLPSARVRSADADGDGDPEVIWVGIQGLDLDKDGLIELEENGMIAGFGDVDGNSDLEIIVQDRARSRGDYFAGGFGFHRDRVDRLEVLWAGVLSDTQRSTGAIVGIIDADSDGDDEILIEPGKEDYVDVDRDGDADIIIGSQN